MSTTRRITAILVILITLATGLVGAVPGSPDQDGMLADLGLLLQWGDRASGSAHEQSAAKLIGDRFKELGLQVETQSFTERGIQSQNVIGIKPGSDPQAGVITVTAHYDSAMPGAPGANDNASGTVVMMELARLWSGRVTSSTIQFIAFGAEERGLLGARHYLTTPRAKNVALNLNLDMVGKGGKVSLDRAPAWLIKAIAQSARQHDYPFKLHYGTLAAMRSDGSPTDGMPFAEKSIPTVTFASAEGLEDYNYHTPADNRANVSGEDLMRIAVVANDLVDRYDGQKVPWGDKNFIALTILGRLLVTPSWVGYVVMAVALLIWTGLWWTRRQVGVGFWMASKRGLQTTAIWTAAVVVVELVAVFRRRLSPGTGYPWHYLVAVVAAGLVFWLLDGRRGSREDQGQNIGLTAIAIPVVLMIYCMASAAWDYALMLALVIIPASASAVSTSRWRRLIWWVLALLPFLYLSASNWLPRAGTIRAILEFAYIPALGMMTVQVLQIWARRPRSGP